jgi:hypothetical protein
MVKIVQIISCVQQSLNSRICEVIGSYSDSKDPNLLIVGSNKYLSWKVQDWSYVLEAHIEKTHLKYGRVLVERDIYVYVNYRIWIK